MVEYTVSSISICYISWILSLKQWFFGKPATEPPLLVLFGSHMLYIEYLAVLEGFFSLGLYCYGPSSAFAAWYSLFLWDFIVMGPFWLLLPLQRISLLFSPSDSPAACMRSYYMQSV